METSDILARFAKAREFEAVAGGWKFRMRLPTDFHERRFAMETSGIAAAAQSQQWLHDMLLAAVIGWEGPTLDDLLHEGDKTPLPYAPALVAPLLESKLELFDELSVALHAERAARLAKVEAAAKNSASASTGS
jgi:hypothetical protein